MVTLAASGRTLISEDFHVVALEWTSTDLVWFIDGREVRTVMGKKLRSRSEKFGVQHTGRGGWAEDVGCRMASSNVSASNAETIDHLISPRSSPSTSPRTSCPTWERTAATVASAAREST